MRVTDNMALSFLGGGGHASYAKYFDIRLEDEYIVFRGNDYEAASAHLGGTLVLCLSEPLTIKNIKLHLTGMSRVCWHYHNPATPAGSGRKHYREKVFYQKTWTFRDAGKGKTEVLRGDNYEFPFEVILEGNLPETVEGLADNFVTYRFKAEIGRKYAKDIVIRKPLRIIRTLDSTALELAHAMSVDNTWPDKIEYSINTPSKAVVFGTSVQVDFKLIPLLKGLKIGQIESQLIETHDLTLNPEDHDSLHNTYKTSRTITTDEYEMNPDADMEIIDYVAEGYQVTRRLNLPKSLTKCLQDTDTRGIRVRHKLKFRIQLHNPDGHVSELRATLPVSIFISPNLPLDENNNLVDQSPETAQRAIAELSHQAPPLYGQHTFDQLYREVDNTGYRTPCPMSGAVSGAVTPFGALSRNISSENLPSMNEVTNTDISASALHSRLAQVRASTNPHPPSPNEHSEGQSDNHLSVPTDYFANPHGSGTQTPASTMLSRRPSTEEHDQIPSGMATPFCPQYAEVESLSRVPSYSTAVRTTVKPRDSGLPDYDAVVSGDSPPLPQSPQRAHTRSGHRSPTLHFSAEVQQRLGLLHRRHSSHSSEGDERGGRLFRTRSRGS